MKKNLLIKVYLLDDRYHGEGDWPPSPARLFQALIAGNAIGLQLSENSIKALRWLESEAGNPLICSQPDWPGQKYENYVPNNDLDAFGGMADKIITRKKGKKIKKGPAISFTRVEKKIHSRHIDSEKPIIYGWQFNSDKHSLNMAETICSMTNNIYQLGRGVDAAWAIAEILSAEEGNDKLSEGILYQPGSGSGGVNLLCPQQGTLDSLLIRYRSNINRFRKIQSESKSIIHFANPPKPVFSTIKYNPVPQWQLYELRGCQRGNSFRAWPQQNVASLITKIRDGATKRLTYTLPEKKELIERILIGRNATSLDKARRIQLIPLPSVGHTQTNRSIRRVLLVSPPGCPLPFSDLTWAFSGLVLYGDDVNPTVLLKTDTLSMLRHYGMGNEERFRIWRSITPLALPDNIAKRHIDLEQQGDRKKTGTKRLAEHQLASAAVLQALHHAGIRTSVDSVRVQREPFSAKGERAETFAKGTRFAKERLWHVELKFSTPIEGPLVIGDGRYLGLGVMAPVRTAEGILAYQIDDGLTDTASADGLAKALSRAMMARVQQHLGERETLPAFFTGHQPDGAPLRNGQHQHLAVVADLPQKRLLLVAPHLLEGRDATREERKHLALLDKAMGEMANLRAGRNGNLNLSHCPIEPDNDPLFGRFRQWETLTPYQPTRHLKRATPREALIADLLREIERRRLPKPVQIDVTSVEVGPRGGLSGNIRLEFRNAEQGPLLLGRTRHFGGGLFAGI